MKGNVRAKLPRNARRILRKHGHLPIEQERATGTVFTRTGVSNPAPC
jgi:hypothetical protein